MKRSDQTPLEQFQNQLAYTIAWCAGRANPAEPRTCLRSPKLQPHLLAGCRGDMVTSVAYHRYWELGSPRDIVPATDLAGGRLLFYDPTMSVVDGASEDGSNGYFDVYDTPPWDTWVWYVEGEARSYSAGVWPVQVNEFLIAWIPPAMLDLVGQGIAVNPIDCIGWLPLPGFRNPLIDQLVSSGLLPG